MTESFLTCLNGASPAFNGRAGKKPGCPGGAAPGLFGKFTGNFPGVTMPVPGVLTGCMAGGLDAGPPNVLARIVSPALPAGGATGDVAGGRV